jgi:multimeric flavodoxin WrbA
MLILGIVGSPRKDGRTDALITAILRGAANVDTPRDVETRKIYLIDYEIRPHGTEGAGQPCPEALSALVDQADALAIGAPVYWGDINGLTKDFMDSVQLNNVNGQPAAGVAIAGGTGKGLLSGLQSIYHFLYHRQFRAIDPTPVSRFNFEATLTSLQKTGAKLVKKARDVESFPGEQREARWGAVLAHYATLSYLDQGPLDEFIMLARQLIAISKGDAEAQARRVLDQALMLRDQGRSAEAAVHAVRAYDLLYFGE